MHSDLEALKLSDREIERLSGLEVNELWVGGLLSGVYRTPLFQDGRRCLWLGFTELVVTALVFMFSLPLGMAITRQVADLHQPPVRTLFLGTTLGTTLMVMVGWHGYQWRRTAALKSLLHLLNELDHFHQVLVAVDGLDRLAAISPVPRMTKDRTAILNALQLTRDNLVAGLMTEKILREYRPGRTRQAELLSYIEQNLATLSILEIQDQAQDYRQLMKDTLQIGISVQQALRGDDL